MIPVLFLIISIVFVLLYVSGDPVFLMLPEDATVEEVNALREALKLDQPFYIQFGTFLLNVLQGEFGESFRYKEQALPLVLERLPATLTLAAASMLVAIVVAVPLGILSATRKNSVLDLFLTTGTVLGKAMPNFWVGIMLSLVFSVHLLWFPVSGSGTLSHLVLPAITLGTSIAAYIARLTRSSLLEALNQEYIRTAKSKGLRQRIVVYKHALRNAMIPVVTIVMIQTGSVVGGALVTEMIFAWPGLGQLLVQSINARDMAVVQAAIFVIAVLVIVMNLLADLISGLLDPRIKYK